MSLFDMLRASEDPSNYADVGTMFGKAQVYDIETDEGELLRVLDIAGTWQSASYVDERWADLAFGYHRVFDLAFSAPVTFGRALMLGGGALSYPKHVVACHDDVEVNVIEIDPMVTALSEKWFFLDRLSPAQKARLHVHQSDAMEALAESARSGQHYDLIVNDLFAAERPTAALMTEDGIRAVHAVLNPEGIYVANVVSALKGRKKRPLRMVQGALDTVFSQVQIVSLGEDEPRTPDNNVVFATNAPWDLAQALGL